MNKSEWYDGLNNIDAGIVEEYIEEKKRLAVLRKKKNRWLKIGAVAACFAVIICSLIPLISNRIEEKPFRLPTDIDNIVWAKNGENEPSLEFSLWNGWRMNYFLGDALDKAADGQYFALRVTKSDFDDFIYDGKTAKERRIEIKEKYKSVDVLKQLLKEGDALKYGERLYTDGTPDGEKWAEEVFNERTEFYGYELLSTYIVGGEFDREGVCVAIDSASTEIKQLEKILRDAETAYGTSYLKATEKAFADAGICVIIKNGRLFVFVTRKQLAEFDIPEKEKYELSLANRRSYEHEEGDVPTLANNVTGFSLGKIKIQTFDGSSSRPESDGELIDKLNALIRAGEFDTDRICITVMSRKALTREFVSEMNCETVDVTRKYRTAAFNWLTVKYENISPEALRDISNADEVTSITIYVVPDSDIPYSE